MHDFRVGDRAYNVNRPERLCRTVTSVTRDGMTLDSHLYVPAGFFSEWRRIGFPRRKPRIPRAERKSK